MATSIVRREVGADLFLFDPVRDEVHVLNATARLIYELHREGKGLEEIEGAIKETFQWQEDQDITGNILECLAGLKDKGLLP
jgi:hypothetical protein